MPRQGRRKERSPRRTASSTGTGPREIRAWRVSPSNSSITRNGCPAYSPTSNMGQTHGWLSAATACPSRRNRANERASPGDDPIRILIATSRFNRVSRARYTSLMPPVPSGALISYAPSLVPGDSIGRIIPTLSLQLPASILPAPSTSLGPQPREAPQKTSIKLGCGSGPLARLLINSHLCHHPRTGTAEAEASVNTSRHVEGSTRRTGVLASVSIRLKICMLKWTLATLDRFETMCNPREVVLAEPKTRACADCVLE